MQCIVYLYLHGVPEGMHPLSILSSTEHIEWREVNDEGEILLIGTVLHVLLELLPLQQRCQMRDGRTLDDDEDSTALRSSDTVARSDHHSFICSYRLSFAQQSVLWSALQAQCQCLRRIELTRYVWRVADVADRTL